MDLCERAKCSDSVWCIESSKAICSKEHECNSEHLDLRELKIECSEWVKKEFNVLEEKYNVIGLKQMNEMEGIKEFLEILMKTVSDSENKFKKWMNDRIEYIPKAREKAMDIVEKAKFVIKNEGKEVKESISEINDILNSERCELKDIETFTETIKNNKEYYIAKFLRGVYYGTINDPFKIQAIKENFKEIKTLFEQNLKELKDQMDNERKKLYRLTGVSIKKPVPMRNGGNRCTC